jgi:hypothetical protein
MFWSILIVATLAGLLLASPLLVRVLDMRASSFRSRFSRDRDALLARPMRATPSVTESDLAGLPVLMQAYLRRVGAVGRPRVRNLRLTFSAQMRNDAASAWMRSTATQYESFDPPARLFYMNASRTGIPFDVLHRYVDGAATFQVRIASLISMVDKSGPVLAKAETVTLMNDIVVFAPAAVLDLPFSWRASSAHTVDATFTNASYTVTATLMFDDNGDLVGFLSNDRTQESASGSRSFPWSTPISDYRVVDGIRVGAHGDANWIEPSGEWTYGQFDVQSIAYNVTR